MTARLHTSPPEPLSFAQARDALEALPMDTALVEADGRARELTVGRLHWLLLNGYVTPGTVGSYLVAAGRPIRCEGGDPA